ncbi:MAG TPA: hypothetical protein VGL58_03850 [Caulobacteraceae bacterium]|jgi:hypothetical protein
MNTIKSVAWLAAALCLVGASQAAAQTSDGDLDARAAQARQRVSEIVNQPITHIPRTDEATVFSPGWFHDGATKPDFDSIDVRTTQEFPYHGYVTSDVTPTEMFHGGELEFNANTKYFYADRNLPKKRLSEAEMVEINGLYRVIGRDEQVVKARWRLTEEIGLASVFIAALLLLIRRPLSQAIDRRLGRTEPAATPAR